MCDKQKIQQLLRYVWNPLIGFSTEDVLYITDLICESIESLDDVNNISDLLKDISIKKYHGNISTEKSMHVAKLIIDFNGGSPIKTDYGRMRFIVSGYYTFLSYKNVKEALQLTFAMTVNGEIVLEPNKLPFEEEEKHQLINVMQEKFKNKVIIYNDENAEYINNNLSVW